MSINNIYISTTFLKDNLPLSDALDLCLKNNINNIELGSNHCYESSYKYLSNYPFQYILHNYFPIPKDSFVLNISSFDENIRDRSLQHIKKAIDLCSALGAGLYTFHPGFLTDPKGSNVSKDNYDFQWDETQLESSSFTKAVYLMYNSLDYAIGYAKSRNVKIAIETEGSLSKKDHLLMQKPEEYKVFMDRYSPDEIGINLNIGHLNLAKNAFNFKATDFVDLIQNYIVAMEISHNNGLEDEHLPILEEGWYWSIIKDQRFSECFKILEFRNTSIEDILKNIKMIDNRFGV